MGTIHNIAIAGHGTSGKTTLLEEMLFLAKSTGRAGKIDDGSSILDHDAEERERQFTIDNSTCHLDWNGQRLHFIDTPGYPDFVGTVIDAFSVVETALIAIDGAAGIRVNTRRVWTEAEELGLARIIVLTRLDSEGALFDERVEEIQEAFGTQCVPIMIPNAVGANFSEVETTYPVSDSSSDRAKEINKQLIESVVEADEELMERYLMEDEIKPEEIDEVFGKALVSGSIVPILCVSGAKGVGLKKSLDILTSITPPHDFPLERKMVTKGGDETDATPHGSDGDPFLARVFKVVGDPFVGKLSYFRVFSGSCTPNMAFTNLSQDEKERITTVLRMQGKEQENLDKAGPGDLVAVPKLESLEIGDTIGDPSHNAILAPIHHPTPMVKLAVEPKSRNDETKVSQAFLKLAQGDSCFSVDRIAQTRELVIAGRSTLHLDVQLSRLKRRFELEVDTKIPKTSYLESITGASDAQYKHKKQTGGRGQYGEVYIKLEKADPGQGLDFVNSIVGGVIPQGFIPAVEKGVRETMDGGILAGCPIIDCRVTLYDGSYHNVDSSEAAFKTAAREAFKKAYMAANPVLLEPIVNMEVHVPTKFMGDITGDLNSRRGRIQGMDTIGDTQAIRAQVPEAEIKSYSTELRSLTGGEGSYSVEFSHYEPVPGNVQQQIIAQLKADAEKKD